MTVEQAYELHHRQRSKSSKADVQPVYLKRSNPDRIAIEKALTGFFYATQVRIISLYDL
jgi:hypothetical protein